MIRLVDVYEQQSDMVVWFLYKLLLERNPVANISHREMPTFEQHRFFVQRAPYKAWYVIFAGDDPVGSVYLTNGNEIGIALLNEHQGCGHAVNAVRMLMERHPGERFLANIAPGNARSISMFENMGFDLIQLTLAKETK